MRYTRLLPILLAIFLATPALAISAGDLSQLDRAVGYADKEKPRQALGAAAQIKDPLVRKLAQWRAYDRTPEDFTLTELEAAMATYKDWPGYRRMRNAAEEKILSSGRSQIDIYNWFADDSPKTADGQLAYAKSLKAFDRTPEANAIIKGVWRESLKGPEWQNDALRAFGDVLTSDDHAARAEMLRFHGYTQTLSALKKRTKTRDDTRLHTAYKQAVRDSRRDRYTTAASTLMAAPDPQSRAVAHKMWNRRAIITRGLLKARQYDMAYRLVSDHHLSEMYDRGDYAEGEWLAGWIALRFLQNPVRADRHFAALQAVGTTPITQSRALYWRGRVADARKLPTDAQRFYAMAAEHSLSFYGQLAAERVGNGTITLRPQVATDFGALRQYELGQVLDVLAAADQEGLFNRFVLHFDDQLKTPEEHAALAELVIAHNKPHLAVRISKTGYKNDVSIPVVGYPLRSIPTAHGLEPVFALALIRQESEFNPKARSHANARGLMQMLPTTARLTARKHGVPYSTARLYDADYNARLGTYHLSDLLADFNGSYIMTAAAYNAGARRPEQWVQDYGDPRLGQIDPLDFIELIPFRETRNYVMRVMEATQVYRARTNGGTATITLSEDLRRGQM